MPFAQLVVGPPGSGKSTYCDGMHQFLGAIGRKSSVVNLDPANEATSYPCAVDVRELVSVEDIMGSDPREEDGGEALGPNGAVLYALETLEQNFEWLETKLGELGG
jgi:GPN-loop GTPase